MISLVLLLVESNNSKKENVWINGHGSSNIQI